MPVPQDRSNILNISNAIANIVEANRFIKLHGTGLIVSIDAENCCLDTGSFQSLVYLDPTGRVDKDRVMVLRTASNYTMQPPGMTAADSLLGERGGEGYSGLAASVEAAYAVGSKVVDEIVGHWDRYRDEVPAAP